MTATRPCRHRKRAFLVFLAIAGTACAQDSDPGWRLTVVPSFQRPLLHEKIPRSQTAVLAAARHTSYGELEYATTPGAMRHARAEGEKHGAAWIATADVSVRRDKKRVIDRILITGDDPLLPSLAVTPAFYDRFEPLLGDGFYVIIPERGTIALYPRLAGGMPPEETAELLEAYRLAAYPVSREVFRATRTGLVAGGILEE